ILNASKQLGRRATAAHKGDFGHVVIVGGDYGFGGAALMAAETALRSGAGLVSVITRSQHRSAMLARRPELMVAGSEDESHDMTALLQKANVIVVGPGLGRGEWSRAQLQACLGAQLHNNIPLVIDADGLNLLAERDQGDTNATQIKRDNWILTPHPGEAARLLQCENAEVAQDRFAAVQMLQEKWGGHCLLKGHGSLIANKGDNERVYLCSEGNPGMATGGMGDVLAGLIGGLVAQRLELARALRAAVCIHGEAADLAAQSGERGLIATDLLPHIRQLVNAQY
ncbi:MAG: NAD(P)H-hydrate dehydratase, partial [Pseudomonadales bacterium]|nr:NAD(P)H-hydrate dehydratase [Pseudomonadales bacterium]